MTTEQRQKYNREHYLRNRDIRLTQAKAGYKSKREDSGYKKIIPLFQSDETKSPPPPQAPKAKKSRVRMPWQMVLMTILVITISGFLFSETAKFYSEFDEGGASAYLKAFILEGAAIAFSILKGRTWVQRCAYRLMVALIYSYSIWVVSGGVIQKSISQQVLFQNNKQVVSELEAEISKLTSMRDTYFSQKRFSVGLNVDQSLKIFKQKLDQARETSKTLPSSSVLLNTLMTLVVFRVLAMISNFLLLKELRQLINLKNKLCLKSDLKNLKTV